MGNYNPYAPRILGEEWVPIRDEELVYSPNVNSVEIGTQFSVATSRQVRTARFYVNQLPDTVQLRQCGLVNIYPAGTEDQTGPISEVIIPVNNAATTGANISLFGGATSVVDAVYQPGDGRLLEFDYNSTTAQRASFWFAVNNYPVLANKRILNVSLLYAGYVQDKDPANGALINFVNPTPNTSLTLIRQRNDAGLGQTFTSAVSGSLANTGTLELATTVNNSPHDPAYSVVVNALDLGDINNYWDPAIPPSTTATERQPWRYVDLQRFEASSGLNRQHIFFQVQLPTTAASPTFTTYPTLWLDYIALRVIYCEEKRVAYGARLFGYSYGMNQITMRDTSFNADPILPAGTYLPTLSWVSPGQTDFGQSTNGSFPELNAARELYQIPSHPASQVLVPFPLAERIGETFTRVETHVLPQLSLHASGGTLTEPHVYGRQAIAQVYGSITATQDIYDDISGVSATYPWVRYYARRFGDTTVPLTLTGVGGLSGSSVAITPAEFDALDQILDGWKEVTLRFSTPPTMGAVGGFPAWTWSAVGETSGNRWEVLGAAAPALSGIPGNFLNQVPSPNQLGVATYQPTSGDTVELTWMPQGINGPWVTGATADAASDAVLIFAQDMPTVTGFAVINQTQALTGIGQDCGVDPCCIPTDIVYNRITWSLPSWLDNDGGLELPGIAGSYASTPDNAALDIVGDIDLRADLTLANWSPGFVAVAKWTSAGNQRSYVLGGAAGGFVQIIWSANGIVGAAGPQSTVPVPVTSGRLAIRATLDVDNGAAGNTTTFFTAPTIAGPWTQLGAPVINGGVTSIFSGTAVLEVGSIDAGTGSLLTGTVHAVEVRNGIDGTAVANPNFASQPGGTTSFTDAAGRVWTVNGSASIVDGTNLIPSAGAIELQRRDTIETDFQTIMSATSFITGFNDYEARVGITSDYQIRLTDVYNFPGPWSSTVSATIPSPGVSGGCLEDGHILIFTSNERQNGSINLAYSSAWMDQQVSEDFVFPEAGFVQLQLMYNKDFYTAFRPLERGGERFSRTVLVQAAAIAPETLADFTALRDMAWDTVNYICVRDEDGNRWFATVLVPAGRVLRDRRLYLAPVDIIEVTATPTPVDP
jgi:hypothetical protein